MATPVNNRQRQNAPIDAEEMRKLKYPDLAFNVMGIEPTSVQFIVSTNEVENFVKGICNDTFGQNEINSVEIDSMLRGKGDSAHGQVELFVWFRADSRHLVDKTLVDDSNAIIHDYIPRYSDQLKQFMKRYCREENQRVYSEGDGRGRRMYQCLKLDLGRIFGEMFDRHGKWYNYVYSENGEARRRESIINVQAVWDENSRKVKRFIVIKTSARDGNRRPLRPQAVFKPRSEE